MSDVEGATDLVPKVSGGVTAEIDAATGGAESLQVTAAPECTTVIGGDIVEQHLEEGPVGERALLAHEEVIHAYSALNRLE